jgi:hypothetical protein
LTAGPSITSPSTVKRDPWHGQSHVFSALLNATWQPVRAGWRHAVQASVLVSMHRDRFALDLNDLSVAGRDVGDGAVARPDPVADQVHRKVDVLAQERAHRGERLDACRREKIGVRIGDVEAGVAEDHSARVPKVMPLPLKPVAT